VQFLTFNPTSHYSPDSWRQIAVSSDTLVFYMAAKILQTLLSYCCAIPAKPFTPLAIIEQATTIHQQVHITT
jgi:siroheme synthase